MDKNTKEPEVEIVPEKEEISELKNVSGFYEKIRENIRSWAKKKGGKHGLQFVEVILTAPDLFILLVRLARDSRVSVSNKVLILAGITYFMTPIDILPEAFLGPAGFIDDVVLATYILDKVLNSQKDIVLEHWSGSVSLLNYLQNVSAQAQNFLGDKAYKRVNKYFSLLGKTNKN